MSVLGRELRVSVSAMTRLADRLETAGMAKRTAEAGDRRVRCLQLTPRGARIMRRRNEARVRRAQDVLECLSPGEREEVLKALEMLMNACRVTNLQHTATKAAKVEG